MKNSFKSLRKREIVEKLAKDVNKPWAEETQMANTSEKKKSVSWVVKERQIKTVIKYHSTSTSFAWNFLFDNIE